MCTFAFFGPITKSSVLTGLSFNLDYMSFRKNHSDADKDNGYQYRDDGEPYDYIVYDYKE